MIITTTDESLNDEIMQLQMLIVRNFFFFINVIGTDSVQNILDPINSGTALRPQSGLLPTQETLVLIHLVWPSEVIALEAAYVPLL